MVVRKKQQTAPGSSLCLAWGLLLLLQHAAAQGLRDDTEAILGAQAVSANYLTLYQQSLKWARSYAKQPHLAMTSCQQQGPGGASLCSAAQAQEEAAVLLLATSPHKYDARSRAQTGGWDLAGPVGDQGACASCVAFSVTSAARAAVAAALQTDASTVSLSPQDFFFCKSLGRQEERSCSSGMSVAAGMQAFAEGHAQGQYLVTERCLPYVADRTSAGIASSFGSGDLPQGFTGGGGSSNGGGSSIDGGSSSASLLPLLDMGGFGGACQYMCDQVDRSYKAGRFTFTRLGSAWEVQANILAHGSAVVTRLEVFSDLQPFFARQPKGVYPGPGRGAAHVESHSITLVGYNLQDKYWIAKSSWGVKFADGGFFRVAFNASVGVCNPKDTFAMKFNPDFPPAQPPVTKLPGRQGCYTYKAAQSDYAYKVAAVFGLPVQQLLQDNLRVIRTPEQLLGGLTLTLCGIQLVKPKPKPRPPVVASQVEALLAIRSMIDKNGVLASSWSLQNANRYSEWPGVDCDAHGLVTRLAPEGQLGGRLPDAVFLQMLPQMEILNLASNNLTGSIPGDYSLLRRLRALYAYSNSLTGTLPLQLGVLAKLEVLDLSSNRLQGSLPAAWHGMESMQALKMHYNRLTGQLPEHWGQGMANLSILSLAMNRIGGALPGSWQAMQQMQYMLLLGNNISGSLPSSWSRLSKLKVLALAGNALEGTLPAEYAALHKLESLYMFINQFSGPLPWQWGAGLTSIRDIDLSENGIVGSLPATWSDMVLLQSLVLHHNRLTGQIPSAYSKLRNLVDFDIHSNGISGTLASWHEMQQLKTLNVAGNYLLGPLPQQLPPNILELRLYNNLKLHGQLPASWGNLKRLKLLYAYNCLVSGKLPAEFASLSNLEVLSLSYNKLTGTLPAAWGDGLRVLNTLYLHNNSLTGTLPLQWAGMKSLLTLRLNDNNLVGSLPASWAAMKQLTLFSAYNNSLSGRLPAEYASMSSLEVLSLSYNKLTGTLPAAWGDGLRVLNTLYLHTNSLAGTLPPQWAGMTNMTDLQLSHNNFIGSLPASWAAMKRLNCLMIGNCTLAGSLPASWGSSMKQLQHIKLSTNRLSGQLPAAWSGMSNLKEAYLENNRFTGSLPADWCVHLSHLQHLDLQNCSLSGQLLSNFSGMKGLVTLRLSRNAFSGTLPVGLSALARLQELWVDNNAFSGKLPAQLCPGLSNLEVLALHSNRFLGAIPDLWPSCMKRLRILATFNNAALTGCVPATFKGLLLRPAATAAATAAAQAQLLNTTVAYLTSYTNMSGFCTN